MTKITNTSDLKSVILQLENRKKLQEQLLREQFQATYKSLRPINIIKNTIKEAVASHDIQNSIIESAANLAANFITKKVFQGTSESELKKYLGKLLHYGITTVVGKNSDAIRTIGECFVTSFLTDRKKQTATAGE